MQPITSDSLSCLQNAVIDKQQIALDGTYRQLQEVYAQLRHMEQVKSVPRHQNDDHTRAHRSPEVIPRAVELLSVQSQQTKTPMNQLQQQFEETRQMHQHRQQQQQQQQHKAMAEQALVQLQASHSQTQLQDQQTIRRLQDEVNKLQTVLTTIQTQLPQDMLQRAKDQQGSLVFNASVASRTTKETLEERSRDLETEQVQLMQPAQSLNPPTQGRVLSEPHDMNTSVMSQTREPPPDTRQTADSHVREVSCGSSIYISNISVMSRTREALKERIAELEPLTYIVAGMEEMQTQMGELEVLLAKRTEELEMLRNRLSENIEAFQISSAYIRELELRLYGKGASKQGENDVQEKRIAFLQADVVQLRLALAQQEQAQVPQEMQKHQQQHEKDKTALLDQVEQLRQQLQQLQLQQKQTLDNQLPFAIGTTSAPSPNTADIYASDLPAPTRSVTAQVEKTMLDSMKTRIAQLEDERAAAESRAQDSIAALVQQLTLIEEEKSKFHVQLQLEAEAKAALQRELLQVQQDKFDLTTEVQRACQMENKATSLLEDNKRLREQMSELQLVLSESRRRSRSTSRESRDSTEEFAGGERLTLKAENEELKKEVTVLTDEIGRLLNALTNLQNSIADSEKTAMAPGSLHVVYAPIYRPTFKILHLLRISLSSLLSPRVCVVLSTLSLTSANACYPPVLHIQASEHLLKL